MKATENKEKEDSEASNPYMSKGIYRNYEKTMKEKNVKRKKEGLTAIPIRSYKEWSR